MLKLYSTPRAIILVFIAAIASVSASITFTTRPAIAAPVAQNSLPDFTLNAQTVISVTVAISDGQVIVIPVALILEAQNQNGDAGVSLLTDFEEQAGIFIGISPTSTFSATLLRPGENLVEQEAPAPTTQPRGEGTHVTNTNSRLRAGPGTNFDIVGRVPEGGTVTVVGQNDDGTWYQLDDGSWIAEFLVEPIETGQGNDGGAQNNSPEQGGDTDAEADSGDSAITAPDDQTVLTAYLGEITAIGSDASVTLEALESLAQEPQPLSSQWRDAVASQLAALAGALDQYLALAPVQGYEDFHTQLTNVVLTCEQAVDYLASGLTSPYILDEAQAIQSVQACSSQASALTTQAQTLQ